MKPQTTLAFVFLLLFAVQVQALAMGPARVEYIFKPGMQGEFTLKVTENAGEQTSIVMYAEGELAEYITDISPSNFTLKAHETRDVIYKFKLPESLPKYGRNETLVIAKTASLQRQRFGQFTATVAIGHQWWVHVPYPYKYAEATVRTENVPLSVILDKQPMFFDVRITNLGSEDLQTALTFEIKSPEGKTLKKFAPRNNPLPLRESKIEEFDWIPEDPSSIRPGIYSTVAKVEFGGDKPTIAGGDFKIGTVAVVPQSIEHENIYSDEIGKIQVRLESLWGNQIQGIYSDAYLLEEGSTNTAALKKTSASNTINMDSWSTGEVEMFLDARGIPAKTYDLNVVSYFGTAHASKIFKLEIKPKRENPTEPKPERDNSQLYLLGVIGLLFAIILALAFVAFRKRK